VGPKLEPDHLRSLATSAIGAGGVFESAVAAAAAGSSLTQLTAALGKGSEPARVSALPSVREAAPFEELRDASDRHVDRSGTRPKVFLAAFGQPAEHRLRVDFARNLLAAGGIQTVDGEGFEDAAEAAAALTASGTRTAVVCSSNERYPELVPALAGALKRAGASLVLVTGRTPTLEAEWRSAGVDDFLYAGCDAIALLRTIFRTEGVDLV
jgi:methylmalonyl-CoA mutase